MKRWSVLFAFFLLQHAAQAQRVDSLAITGGYLFFHVYGAGKPVVILTGGPGISCGQQEDVARHVGTAFQAILVEQRGTGRSVTSVMDKEHINIDTAAADIKRILDHLQLKEAVIYGHSYGSLLAMYFGTRYPKMVTSLVFAGPAPFNYVGDQMATYGDNKEARFGVSDLQVLADLDTRAAKGQLTGQDSANFRKILNSPIVYDKSRMDSVMKLVAKGRINNKTMMLLSGSYRQLDLTAQIKQFRKPIGIICGKQDPLAFMAYEYKLVNPHVKIDWIDRAGHFAMFEQEKSFYDALFQFLKPNS